MRARHAWGALLAAALIGLSAGSARAATPTDPAYGKQWGMQLIGAPTAWDWATGKGITIAIADTGVDLQHEDLAANVLPGGANLVTPGASPQDDHGHGSHVAGIAAAVANNNKGVVGVAPDAKILPVKVLGSDGKSVGNSVEDGIAYAAAHGAKVINLSLAGLAQDLTGASFTDACENAYKAGAVCVVAAGNGYVGGSGIPSDAHIVVVSATTKDDAASQYSSGVGSAMWGIAAPGGAGQVVSFGDSPDDIFSTYWQQGTPNVYAYDAGTSMAAPHVSGALAVLISLGLSPEQAVTRLLTSAKKLGNPTQFGAGRLDLAAAVKDLPKPGTSVTPSSTTTAPTAVHTAPTLGTAPPSSAVQGSRTTRPTAVIGTVPKSASGGGDAIGNPEPVTSVPKGVAVGNIRSSSSSNRYWLWIGGAVVLLAVVGGAWVASRLA